MTKLHPSLMDCCSTPIGNNETVLNRNLSFSDKLMGNLLNNDIFWFGTSEIE